MSWMTRLFGGDNASTMAAAEQPRYGATSGVSDPWGWIVRALGGLKTNAGTRVSEHTALQIPAVYACVNRIANPIASFPLRILQRKEGGGSSVVTQHPMSERLGLRPNDFMSSRTLRKVCQGHALLWGNGYLEIERNGQGQAVGLWPLLADRTSPVRVGEGLVVRTNIAGDQIDIDHGNVLHVMDQSQDGYRGISQVAMSRQAMGMALALEEFGGKFFANDMKSGGFLLHPGKLSAQARTNLESDRARGPGGRVSESRVSPDRTDPGAQVERQGGLENAHRIKVLEEGMKFIQTTIPPEDAQFLATREMQIAEIARIYDVPLVLLQSHEKTTSWGAGIEQLSIGFVQQTIGPWVNGWEQELNWKLFTTAEREKGLYVKFNMNAMLRGDSAARGALYKALFENGALSPNQICALEDMDPIGPEGDERFVSTKVMSLKKALDPNTPPPPSSGVAFEDDEKEAA